MPRLQSARLLRSIQDILYASQPSTHWAYQDLHEAVVMTQCSSIVNPPLPIASFKMSQIVGADGMNWKHKSWTKKQEGCCPYLHSHEGDVHEKGGSVWSIECPDALLLECLVNAVIDIAVWSVHELEEAQQTISKTDSLWKKNGLPFCIY